MEQQLPISLWSNFHFIYFSFRGDGCQTVAFSFAPFCLFFEAKQFITCLHIIHGPD